jgi:spermidine/putrescine transport system permease protein
MIPSIQGNRFTKTIYYFYIALFLLYLFGPLLISAVLAFNNSTSPSFPWQGFTLKWFFSKIPGEEGVFGDQRMVSAILSSLKVALWVTLLAIILGTTNAFLFEREQFPGKNILYLLMLAPLVVPGVILGISILSFAHTLSKALVGVVGRNAVEFLQPGFWLVVFGQLSFIVTLTTLVIVSRLKKFDLALEEAAMDLGASKAKAILTITLRFLTPAIVGAGILAFLFSFENFNTTYFVTGADPTLPILLYSRLRFGITPQINAVSVLLQISTAILGLTSIVLSRR